MFERVLNQNKNVSITLFTKIYEMMLNTKEIEQLGKIKNKQNENINLNIFLNYFEVTYQEKIKQILKNKNYIPQEIINAEKLKKQE